MGHQILDITYPHICPLPGLVPELFKELMYSVLYRGKTLSPISQRVAQTLDRLWQPSWPCRLVPRHTEPRELVSPL